MSRRHVNRGVLVLLLLGLILTAGHRRTKACGPFFSLPVFVGTVHPDPPWDVFVAGNLGLVTPTWARAHLLVAYRYLAGRPPAPVEQKGFLSRWAGRSSSPGASPEEARDGWLKARAGVPTRPRVGQLDLYRYDKKTYSSYLNCPADAFRTAAAMLDARVQQLGATHPAVYDWLVAQDAVFTNCAGPRTIPPPVAGSEPAAIRADRDYQIASALFYAGDYEAARQAFRQIAADSHSPWRTIAPYLVARALVRQGTVAGDRASLELAARELRRLEKDEASSEYRPAVRRLLDFVTLRIEPEARLRDLASALSGGSAGESAEQQLQDYTVLLDHYLESQAGVPATAQGLSRAGLDTVRKTDEMTDWILTFQTNDDEARAHALDRWRQSSSPAWLIAALAKTGPGDQQAAALIEAAGGVSEDAPAFPTVTYHATRLMIGAGETDRARARIDAVLPRARRGWTRSALNALVAKRASLERNLGEFVIFGLRQPAFFSSDLGGLEGPEELTRYEPYTGRKQPLGGRETLTIAPDMAETLNGSLPLSLFLDVATSPAVPGYLQRDLAVAAWTRAVMLDVPALGDRAAAIVARSVPELKPAAEDYLNARDGGDKRFALVLAALRNPGVSPVARAGLGRTTPISRIDDFRDNWWCGPGVPVSSPILSVDAADGNRGAAAPTRATFPGERERAAGRAEWTRLEAHGAAPNYLAGEALGYARAHPADPRVPEALALAVRATRFGCTDADTTRWSKAAFTLLHQKYPDTPWAKQTKYYY
jgi:hypothetical protein